MTTWVPRSCTLPTTEQPLRVAEFDALFAERLADVSRPERLRLELVLTGGEGLEATVRGLVARESGCCSFFTFTVRPGPQHIGLDVEVDGAHEAVLDALQERAAAVAARDVP
jgi:hypothetical protein